MRPRRWPRSGRDARVVVFADPGAHLVSVRAWRPGEQVLIESGQTTRLGLTRAAAARLRVVRRYRSACPHPVPLLVSGSLGPLDECPSPQLALLLRRGTQRWVYGNTPRGTCTPMCVTWDFTWVLIARCSKSLVRALYMCPRAECTEKPIWRRVSDQRVCGLTRPSRRVQPGDRYSRTAITQRTPGEESL